MASGIAPRLPLIVDADDGAYKNLKTLKDVVKQNLKMVLLTIPGERIMDPLFGVGIKKYLFEQNVEETYGVMNSEIRAQVTKYLPFIEIIDILITNPGNDPTLDANFVSLSIYYRILPLDIEDVFSITEPTTN
jgi:phage baseplate assembly protein W